MKVLILANHGVADPASRTRVFQYLPRLRERGVDPDVEVIVADSVFAKGCRSRLAKIRYYFTVVWLSLRAGLRTLVRASSYDCILIQRVLFPFPIPLLMRRHRRRIIYDFDDAIFTTETVDASGLEHMRQWFHARTVAPLLKSASHAVVENDYTAGYARDCGALATVITGPIDTERYRPGEGPKEDGRVVLGWIGSPTTSVYVDLIREPLEALGQAYPNLVLRLVGTSEPRIENLRFEARSWSLETEVSDLQSFDIGLMPLPDDPWTRGKGGYKILQYSAMGLPVVASPVGVNQKLVDHEISGYLARSNEDWVGYLSRLIEDVDLRVRMGREGRARMVKIYGLDRAADRMVSLFSAVSGQNGPSRMMPKHA